MAKYNYTYPTFFLNLGPVQDKAVNYVFTQLVRSLSDLKKELSKSINSLYNGDLPSQLPSHVVASLPLAASYIGGMIYVSDESGGAVPAFSDGTNWRRVTDRSVVS